MRPACRQCGGLHDAYAACVRRPKETTPSQEHQLVGKVLAERYRVGEMIGSGTTGMVFAAEHIAFARPCAIKVVRPRHATPDLVSRVFAGDALAAWGLPHPSLVEVFDIGSLPDGTPFYVSERLDGETLATRIARERLSLAAAIDMMMQLLSAVVALHARELLVRDLRPTNVFLVHRRGCRPLVKLFDVGLARLTPLDKLQEEWTTLGPLASGHPHYLSPERVRGEHAVELASDLFVAGAIFYEALAGVRAFDGTSWRGIVDAISAAEPKPLHERRGDVSPELSQFVARSMAQNPRRRPATAKEMQDELRGIFEDARKASVSMYAPGPSIMGPGPASKRSPPAAVTGRMVDPYREDTSTQRSTRTPAPQAPQPPDLARAALPSIAEEAPHPAVLEEMEQTLERVGGLGAPPEPLTQPGVTLLALNAEDEETQNTNMSPEIRARIDQLLKGSPPPKSGNKPRP